MNNNPPSENSNSKRMFSVSTVKAPFLFLFAAAGAATVATG